MVSLIEPLPTNSECRPTSGPDLDKEREASLQIRTNQALSSGLMSSIVVYDGVVGVSGGESTGRCVTNGSFPFVAGSSNTRVRVVHGHKQKRCVDASAKQHGSVCEPCCVSGNAYAMQPISHVPTFVSEGSHVKFEWLVLHLGVDQVFL